MAYIKDLRARVGKLPLIMTSASGALLNTQQQILLQARADTGNWGFPGGYMEFGESFRQTLIREFKEDAGMVIEPVKLLGILDQDIYQYPNGDLAQPVNTFYLVELADQHHYVPKPSETTDLKYFDPEKPPRFFNHQHEKMWGMIVNYLKTLTKNK
ncbi:NUDIX hydrolase [uncultured Limosilactobacillus sp.]|uniref:NUDIX hydrolase n=1 Tax=uncultured Limosilactobacillus sp. TaxID=2837629 RepID=UPI0025DBE0A5|nr:NUDIX hydrolase [uncultured Limosilactobacillus sp.]